ncbi:MAG: T9SS type A sorting domain-containing protein [Chlorobi bacterium]|nr:T9SS type A sorting domain-containing protein [Chlorobiota bacterium]
MKIKILLTIASIIISGIIIGQSSFIKWINSPKNEILTNLEILENEDVYFYSYMEGIYGTGSYYEIFNNYSKHYYTADLSLTNIDSLTLNTKNDYKLAQLTFICEYNGEIILFGPALDTATYDMQLYMVWLDGNMNLLRDSIYGLPGRDDMMGGFFIDHNDNIVFYRNYLGGKDAGQKTEIPTALWKFDMEGNELGYKLDTIPYMLFLGGIDFPNKNRYQFQSHLYIAHYDYNLDYDTSYFWYEEAFSPKITKQINDSSYFISGEYNNMAPPFTYENFDLSFIIMGDEMNTSNLQIFGSPDTNEEFPRMDYISLDTLFIGGRKSVVPGSSDTWVSIFKTNLEGDVFFQKNFGGYGRYSLTGLLATPDGGCIGTCSYWDFYEYPNMDNTDILFLKFNSDGDLITSVPENTPPIYISDFLVYPNPGKDVLNISSGKDGLVIKLFDLNGKIILEQAFDKNTTINTGFLPVGVYSYRINREGNLLENGKWIKE